MKLNDKYREFPSTPCLHTYIPSPTINVPPQSGTTAVDESTMTHHHHPKSTVYIRAHSGVEHSMGLDKCIMTCIRHCSFIQNNFTALKILCGPPSLPSLLLALATTDLFTVLIVLPFLQCHIVGIIQYVAFSDWLLSLSHMHLRFLHVFYGLRAHLFFYVEQYFIVWMYHSLFIQSPTESILVASMFWQL